MSNAIERVERKWQRQSALDGNLCACGQRSERLCYAHRAKIQAEQRRSNVANTEHVGETGNSDTGDAVERGEVPCELRLINREMGGDWAAETLLFENGLSGGGHAG